jgi:hypothetical protein
MQRLEDAGLLGTMPPAPARSVVDRSLAAVVARAADTGTPAPTRSLPRRSAGRPPLESRPAGARLGKVIAGTPGSSRRGLMAVVERVNAGDELVLAELRRNPALLRRLRDYTDRMMIGLSC